MDKRSGRRAALRGKRVALAVAAAFLPLGEAYALPTGEQFVAGQVAVSRPDPQKMQIDQTSQKGIVNWQGFSISASEHVNITQPNPSAALLNRVVGNSPSEIFGRLTANGQVFLVNNAGVLFAPGSSVEVGSLLASSLSISDANFLNGNYQFYNPGNAGSVVNQGNIVTANGYTALLGPQVRNDGVIVAQHGSVALAAGDRVSLDLIGDGLISVSVDQAALNASVINTGEINADGGTVLLTARSANALLDTVINTSGVIRAVSLVERNGEIVLDGGSRGTVSAGGKLYGGGKVSVLAGDGLVLDAEVNAPALDVAAAGDIAIGANVFSSGPISIRASEPGSDVVFTGNNFFSFGPLSIEAGGDVSFVADGTHNALVTSRGGQTINARSLAVTARGGGIASVINDLGGDQIITLTGGNLDVQMNGGGFAQLGNFGPGSQTIAVDGGQGAITVASRGVDANSFSGSAVLSSASAQTINAGSLTIIAQAGGAAGVNAAEQTITLNGGSLELRTVDGGFHAGLTTFGPGNQSISVHGGGNINVSAGNGGNAVISAENGNQTLAISGGGSFDAHTLAGGGSVQVMTFAGNQTITVRDGDHIAINAADGGSVSARTQAGTQTLSITGAGRNLIAIVAGVGGNASLTSAGGQNINAKSVEITSRDGGFASIGNNNTGDQTITVSDGGIDVHSESGGGFAFITNSGLGSQTISVSDGWGVDVRSVSGGGSGQINNFGSGSQTITVSGGGGVEVQTFAGGTGGASINNIATGNQTIAVSGGTGLDVVSGGGFAAIGNNGPGNQTITVSGGVGIDVHSVSGGGVAFITNGGAGGQIITVSDGSGIDVRSVSGSGSGQITNFGASGQTITVSGGGGIEVQTLSGNGFASIFNGSGSQTMMVAGGAGVDVESAGGFASIGNNGLASQTITVSGGTGVDVQSHGGNANISQFGPGFAQTITATDADHIKVNGVGGNANISAFGGTQNISITGPGANAINIGTLDASGSSQVIARSQNITAGEGVQQGSINIVGSALRNSTSGIITVTNPTGTSQTIDTTGTITVVGGTAPNSTVIVPPATNPPASNAGIFHNSGGLQKVTASGITLQGGTAGNGNAALIVSTGGGNPLNAGNQEINVSGGNINVTGGAVGSNNRAGITTTADQTIKGNPNITVTGGPSGGVAGSNNAFISAGAGKIQTIDAGTISLTSGAGGVNSSASLTGAKQIIHTIGDVVLSGSGSTGQLSGVRIGGLANPLGPTDLSLTVGGNLLITGGSAENNGAGLGSSPSSPAQANNITVNARGDVILNPGTGSGARIGSTLLSEDLAGGNIAITAGGKIELNGNSEATRTAIRTLGSVTLDAGGTISEGSHGLIQAGSLTTVSDGATSLTGPNQVVIFNGTSGSDLTLNNTVALNVGSLSAGGNATVNGSGAVTLLGPWTSAAASVTAATISESAGGFIQAGSLSTNSSGATSLTGPNQVVIFNGTSGSDLTLNNTAALHVTGVNAAGNATLTAGGAMTISGPVVASGAVLNANGSIEEALAGAIVANSLTTTSTGDTTLNGANQVAFFNANSGGDVSLNNTGVLDVTGLLAAGDATINNIGNVAVSGPWSAGGTSSITVGSDILLNSTMVSSDVVLTANDGNIVQASTASITAETLTTTSIGDTLLEGTNDVGTISASSASGDISLRTNSPVLTLSSISLPGVLLVNHTGAIAVRGNVSSLSQSIVATGDVTVGSADAQNASLLFAPGDISIATPGSIVVRASDTTAGAMSAVIAGGRVDFSAGEVSLLGGAAAGTPALVRGSAVGMNVATELKLRGGSGDYSPAVLLAGDRIDLTIGNAVRLDEGGKHSWARIQTEIKDGVIHMVFPSLSEGGYFVNGVEGDIKHGQTGFYTLHKPAKIGDTLLLEYGSSD